MRALVRAHPLRLLGACRSMVLREPRQNLPLAVGQWTDNSTYALEPLNTESVQLYVNQDHPLARVEAPTSH